MTDTSESRAVAVVREYFRKPGVAAVEILHGRLHVGDSVRFHGHTTDFTQKIGSMQINHQDVTEAGEGDLVGILVADRVREHDKVYLEGNVEEVVF